MTKTDTEGIKDSTTGDQIGRLNAVNHGKGPVEVALNLGWQLVIWTSEKGQLRIIVNNTYSEEVISLTRLDKGDARGLQTITMTTQKIEYKQSED